MNAEILHTLATWAWRTSCDVMPLALAALILWRWIPATWRWWLPALVFVRLAMPQVPEADWHWWTISKPPAASVIEPVGLAGSPAPDAPQEPALISPVAVLPAVWGIGVLAVAAWLGLSQWRLRRSIRTAVGDDALQAHCDWAAARMVIPRRVPIGVVRGLPTMAVSGWLRPMLLVPHDLAYRFTTTQICGMMLHEMAHVRRRDVLWTWLALGLCALHWFNPLTWIALRRFHAGRELACDAAALRALDQSAHRDYGEALLLCLRPSSFAHAPALASFSRHFSEHKQRLQNIMNPTSPTVINRLLTTIVVATVVALSFTTARAETRDGEAPKPAPRDGEGAVKKEGGRDGEARKEGARDGEVRKEGTREGAVKKEGAREGEVRKEGARDGEVRKEGARDGAVKKEGARDGEARKEGARDGEVRKEGTREGAVKKEGARDGAVKKEGAREGEVRKEGARDGEVRKEGAREGAVKKEGAREGEVRKEGARDGEVRKEGTREGAVKKEGTREGEVRKEGARDGEVRKEGTRDGSVKKEGAREGEVRKEGARDGEVRKEGVRDGEVRKEGTRDGEARKEGTRDGAAANKEGAAAKPAER